MSRRQPFRHALPVSAALFRTPLYLTHAGREIVKPGEPYPQADAPFFTFEWWEGRTLPEFCMGMLMAGQGILQTSDSQRSLKTGDVFLVRPGEWHRHRPLPAKGWECMWIHFDGDEPLRWLREEAFRLNGNLLTVDNRGLFRAQFEHLLACVHRDPSVNTPNYSRQAMGLLSHVLMDQPAEPATDVVEIEDAAVKAAVEFIWNFSHGVVDVPHVARHLGMARRTLDRKFKTVTGKTVLEEIQHCRITRAVRLLRETTIPIKHIVHRAGFRSAEHLRVTFQQTFGKSPEAYRMGAGGI
ncbi:MAG: AraC family transcriptional regulator [Luteolibacter sp.]